MTSFIMWQARDNQGIKRELTVQYTPEQNNKPQVNFLKVFGCIAYSHIPSQFREKFDEKGEKYIFVGYSDESKGYRLLNPKTEELLISRNVPHHQVHLAHQVQARARQIHQAHQICHPRRCDLLKTFIIHVI
ncbi:hypothetical protein ACOSQ3_028959 [Xanthoceras sorbifolium]